MYVCEDASVEIAFANPGVLVNDCGHGIEYVSDNANENKNGIANESVYDSVFESVCGFAFESATVSENGIESVQEPRLDPFGSSPNIGVLLSPQAPYWIAGREINGNVCVNANENEFVAENVRLLRTLLSSDVIAEIDK